jgi:hypothetical protein
LGKLRVGDNADTVVAQNCSGSLYGDKFPFTLGGFPLTAQKIPLSKNLGWLHKHCCIFTVNSTNFISALPIFYTPNHRDGTVAWGVVHGDFCKPFFSTAANCHAGIGFYPRTKSRLGKLCFALYDGR